MVPADSPGVDRGDRDVTICSASAPVLTRMLRPWPWAPGGLGVTTPAVPLPLTVLTLGYLCPATPIALTCLLLHRPHPRTPERVWLMVCCSDDDDPPSTTIAITARRRLSRRWLLQKVVAFGYPPMSSIRQRNNLPADG